MFRMFSTHQSSTNTQNAASKLLNEIKQSYQSRQFPLQNTMLRTVKLVEDAVEGKRPINNEVIKNAALIDSQSEGNPIIRSLVEKGLKDTLSNKDIEFIRVNNKDAAEFLEKHVNGQCKRLTKT